MHACMVSSSSFISISGHDVIAKHNPDSLSVSSVRWDNLGALGWPWDGLGCLGFTRLLGTGEKRERRRCWWCAYINARGRVIVVVS